MILLSAQHIQKSFGGNTVLRDASLVLQDGQRLGLVGVNGSGKSTLMKIIAGLEPYDGGTLSMQKGLRLGYLAQHYGWDLAYVGILAMALVGMAVFLLMWRARADGYDEPQAGQSN